MRFYHKESSSHHPAIVPIEGTILFELQYYRLKFKYNKSLTNQDQYGQVQQYYSQSVYSVHDGLQVQECNQLEEKNAALDNENQKIYKKKLVQVS